MASHTGPGDDSSAAGQLLELAVRLRKAAIHADRPDVAAKADEVIALVTADVPVDSGGRKPGSGDPGNAILRVMDGLGF